jgi:hypothetical protein
MPDALRSSLHPALRGVLADLWCPVWPQIRAGTGGDEASLWAADLVRMYQKYAATQGWKTQMVSCSEAEGNGYKEAVLQVPTLPHSLLPLTFMPRTRGPS